MDESKGRLVRDDDNDRSDDDEGESRMDFSVNQQARDRQQRKEAFDAAQGSLFNIFFLLGPLVITVYYSLAIISLAI